MLPTHPPRGPIVVARRPGSITFRVHDVQPAQEALPQRKLHQVLSAATLGRVEACDSWHDEVVALDPRPRGQVQPLLMAIHLAFSQHRPLAFGPDAVWATILQGVAHHVAADPERLRPRLVAHQGRARLQVTRDDVHGGSPENPWPAVFRGLARLVQARVRPEAGALLASGFSTTGPVERAALDLCLLDAFQPYFSFELLCVCGIPSVTLEGTPADWDAVAARAERIGAVFELAWWTDRLRPILRAFAATSRGEVDDRFWRAIYKLAHSYGAEDITGWAALLVPYLKDRGERPSRRNPMLAHEGQSITAGQLPSGLAEVPLGLDLDGQARQLRLVGGLVGVTQDPATLTLRPRLGWGVRPGTPLEQALQRLVAQGAAPGRPGDDVVARLDDLDGYTPPDLIQLYTTCDGAVLPGVGRLLSLAELEPVPALRAMEWAELADGTRLALRLLNGEVLSYPPGRPAAAEHVALSLGQALLGLLGPSAPRP